MLFVLTRMMVMTYIVKMTITVKTQFTLVTEIIVIGSGKNDGNDRYCRDKKKKNTVKAEIFVVINRYGVGSHFSNKLCSGRNRCYL